MSRASDVRDAVITALTERLPSETVEAFIVPSYTREELADGPRIAVRYGNREMVVDQGPDERDITIEIGVVGVTPPNEQASDEAYRAAQVVACDAFDGLMESVIALWTPNGVLSRCGMAEHRFTGITQAIQFDPDSLYKNGIWLSMVALTYQDTVDD